MLLDYPSLLIAIGFSAVCLGAILFAAWLTSRGEGFLLTWAIGTALVVGNVFSYSAYLARPNPVLGAFAFACLLGGLSVLYGAARQFRRGGSPWRRARRAVVTSWLIALPPFFIGYDGVAFTLINVAAAILLAMTALEYWRGREEAPSAIGGVAGLYLLVGISFALCAVMLVLEGRAVLAAPPSNWAEDLNLIIIIAGVPGIGALSLALNQTRLARANKREAMTDPLTGLLNRRALFDTYGITSLREPIAVVLFDIDRFKAINDEHGHLAGDRIIARFAQAVRESVDAPHTAARLGGEEFALVLPHANAEVALRNAERVRGGFAALALHVEGLVCSASAGIAFAEVGERFESALSTADLALYQAKHGGRDRIASAGLRVVGQAQTLIRPVARP